MSTKTIKKVMYDGMIENFEKDGFLQPILFFIKDGIPLIIPIPPDIIGTSEGKTRMIGMIKSMCTMPMVSGAGLIIEAYARKFNNDDELGKLVMNGDVKVKDLKDKEDIILMIFSTPEKETMTAHYVDCDNKVVGEKMESFDQLGGLFSGFFNWNKN